MAILVIALLMTVIAPPASADTRKLALVTAVSKGGGEAVFTFLIYGEFEKFTGTAWHNGQAYDLRCAPRGEKPDVLLCRGAALLGGKFVQVVVNGFSFNTYVDQRENESYCNPVYDVAFGFDILDPWAYYGDYCTPTQPAFGDEAWLSGYFPVGTSLYIFSEDGCVIEFNEFGVGWYWADGACKPK